MTRWYFKLCFVFFGKKHAACKWKYIISGFPVSPGSAEALVKWGGKIRHVLIAYFLGNIFAKNCCNRTVYLKIIAIQRWDVFLRHSVLGQGLITEFTRDEKYFHTWCGLSANLGCRSKTCCTRLAANTGRKNSPYGHHRTILLGYLHNSGRYRQLAKNCQTPISPPRVLTIWWISTH